MTSAKQKHDVNVRPMERRDIMPALAMFKKMPDARGALTYRDLVSWGVGQAHDASFVAEIDVQIAGLLLARFTFAGVPVAEVCSILVIAVDPDYHRHHIGSRLVSAVLDLCYSEGVNMVRATIDPKNWELKNFMENLDFKPSGLVEYIKTVEV